MRTRKGFRESVKVEVSVYSECKYTASAQAYDNRIKVMYSGVKAFEIVDGDDTAELLADTDGTCIDDYNEYLVIIFEDDSTATFRNSYVDMMLINS